MNHNLPEKLMKLSFYYLLIIFSSISALHAVDLSGFPPCDSPACQSVATIAEWPKKPTTPSESISFHGFEIHIHKKGEIKLSTSSFQQINYDDKKSLSLTVYQRSDMDELFKASRYTMQDWTNIVFTQTPHDKKPETKAEAFAWYAILLSKVVFVGSNKVTQFTKTPYVVYLIGDDFTGHNSLMIVSEKRPKALLKIELTGFDQPMTLSLIAGLSSAH